MPARRAAFLAAVGMLALSACSNTQSPVNRRPHTGTATASVADGIQVVTIEAGDDYRFHPSTIVVHPGMVRVVLKHTGKGAPHNFDLSGVPGGFVPNVAAGQTRSATFVAPASTGSYQFVCTIHSRQGMSGSMTVTKG